MYAIKVSDHIATRAKFHEARQAKYPRDQGNT